MVDYEKIFEPYYEGGWEAYPLETTLITAGALNAYDAAIMHIEDYLDTQADPNDNLAETYSDEDTYEAGEYRIYNGVLYKCLEDIDEAEEFDPTKWQSCLVTDEMATSGGTTVIANPVGEPTDDLETIQIGETIYDIPGGGGGSANIWTGTLAEYEAQASQIADGTQVNITDDEQEVVEGGTIYSEDEQCVGLWTDNRPLYQKTLVTASDITVTTSGSWVSSGLSAPSGANVVKGELVNEYLVGIIGVFVNSSTGGISFSNIPKTGNITIPSGTAFTITYTKSTDAPLDVVVGKSTMYIASSDCYSTEEKEIGCWRDGKPLYQRVFDLGSDLSITNTTFTNTTIDASSMETLVDAKAIYSAGVTIYNVIANISNSVIRLQADRNDTSITARYIILQYTKTTDTAGSGSYTPASGKAVHYSTDEQVIGTWIDGSTLYRKTFDIGNLLNNGTKTVAHDISNLKYVVNWSGTCYSTIDSGYCRPIPLSDPTATNTIRLDVGGGNINIKTASDWSAYKAFVTLEYTKTS